jgi:hypothetical protein
MIEAIYQGYYSVMELAVVLNAIIGLPAALLLIGSYKYWNKR